MTFLDLMFKAELTLLIRYLEEQQKRQLLRVRPEPRRRIVAACLRAARKQVRQPVIPEDVAVVPESIDDSLRVVRHLRIQLGGIPGRSFYPENGQWHARTSPNEVIDVVCKLDCLGSIVLLC